MENFKNSEWNYHNWWEFEYTYHIENTPNWAIHHIFLEKNGQVVGKITQRKNGQREPNLQITNELTEVQKLADYINTKDKANKKSILISTIQ